MNKGFSRWVYQPYLDFLFKGLSCWVKPTQQTSDSQYILGWSLKWPNCQVFWASKCKLTWRSYFIIFTSLYVFAATFARWDGYIYMVVILFLGEIDKTSSPPTPLVVQHLQPWIPWFFQNRSSDTFDSLPSISAKGSKGYNSMKRSQVVPQNRAVGSCWHVSVFSYHITHTCYVLRLFFFCVVAHLKKTTEMCWLLRMYIVWICEC